MSFRRSRYFLGEAFRGLVRNRLMSVASILTVASCMLIVSVFYCLAVNIEFFLTRIEDEISITVFVYNEVDTDGLRHLYDELNAVEHISAVRYISHSQAFDTMVENFGDPSIFEGFPPDVLPRSFAIEISNLLYHDNVMEHLEALRDHGIMTISHARDVANTMMTISSMVSWVSLILILILMIVSVVIITNTIRITVTARHTEINIMKYVGATDWFIRWPFIIEGIMIGLIGSLLPIVLVWSGYPRIVRMMQDGMPLIEEFVEFRPGHEIFILLFPIVLLLGALIGTIGSGTSVRKHLHV